MEDDVSGGKTATRRGGKATDPHHVGQGRSLGEGRGGNTGRHDAKAPPGWARADMDRGNGASKAGPPFLGRRVSSPETEGVTLHDRVTPQASRAI